MIAWSTRLEEKDGNLSEIEVDEVLGLVGDVGTEVSTYKHKINTVKIHMCVC